MAGEAVVDGGSIGGAPAVVTRRVGAGLIGLGLAAAGALVVPHLTGLHLPGCGADGPCARAASSRWGTLAGWPVSNLGLAYFAGLAVAWFEAGRGPLPGPIVWIARAGAVISLAFLGVIAVEGHWCPYCLAVHAANLAFWLLVERSPKAPRSRESPLIFGAIFAATTAALAMVEARHDRDGVRQAERALADSIDRIKRSTGDRDPDAVPSGPNRLGPADAAIRLVVFSDYQCPACHRIEGDLRSLAASRSDVAVWFRHYPLSRGCNRHVIADSHPNACLAARAAVAAGLVGGLDGFQRMHTWLFDRRGSFDAETLRLGVDDLGLDPDAFQHAIDGIDARRLVHDDIEAAHALGVTSTPTLLLNGVELLGWHAPDGIARAVRAAASSLESRDDPGAPGAQDASAKTPAAAGGNSTATKQVAG